MEAEIASENSSSRVRPFESKSFSACSMSRDPSHSHRTFWCHDLWVNSSVMSRAATAPTLAGTPLQARTIRYIRGSVNQSTGETSPLRFYEKVIKVKADVAALLILFFPDIDDAASGGVENCLGRRFLAFISTLDSSPRDFIIERGTKRNAVQLGFVLS